MSNHFTGLSLGPPLGDQRLDLCDLYAFQSPTDDARTVLILNANPNADALHPDAVYRLAVDTDGDLLNDIAFSFVFSEPKDGRQTVDVYLARGAESRDPEPAGEKIFSAVEVSFTADPNIVRAGDITFAAGARSDAFFFDFDGIKALFDTSGKRNFTEPHLGDLGGQSPWTGEDSNLTANVCSMAVEIPTSMLEADGRSGSGDDAASGRTAPCSTSTEQATRRLAASSTPTTPSSSTTPASRCTTGTAGWTSSSTCSATPAATAGRTRWR